MEHGLGRKTNRCFPFRVFEKGATRRTPFEILENIQSKTWRTNKKSSKNDYSWFSLCYILQVFFLSLLFSPFLDSKNLRSFAPLRGKPWPMNSPPSASASTKSSSPRAKRLGQRRKSGRFLRFLGGKGVEKVWLKSDFGWILVAFWMVFMVFV